MPPKWLSRNPPAISEGGQVGWQGGHACRNIRGAIEPTGARGGARGRVSTKRLSRDILMTAGRKKVAGEKREDRRNISGATIKGGREGGREGGAPLNSLRRFHRPSKVTQHSKERGIDRKKARFAQVEHQKLLYP